MWCAAEGVDTNTRGDLNVPESNGIDDGSSEQGQAADTM